MLPTTQYRNLKHLLTYSDSWPWHIWLKLEKEGSVHKIKQKSDLVVVRLLGEIGCSDWWQFFMEPNHNMWWNFDQNAKRTLPNLANPYVFGHMLILLTKLKGAILPMDWLFAPVWKHPIDRNNLRLIYHFQRTNGRHRSTFLCASNFPQRRETGPLQIQLRASKECKLGWGSSINNRTRHSQKDWSIWGRMGRMGLRILTGTFWVSEMPTT